MESDPNGDEKVPSDEPQGLTSTFPGQLRNVTDARLVADDYLCELARTSPPGAAEHWDDILLVVTELAANTVQYAPGPFELRIRPTFDGVHVTLRDSSTTPPAPRRPGPRRGRNRLAPPPRALPPGERRGAARRQGCARLPALVSPSSPPAGVGSRERGTRDCRRTHQPPHPNEVEQ